jgi:hypothetical protein
MIGYTRAAFSVEPAFAAPELIDEAPAPKAFSSARFDFATSLTATIEGETISLPVQGGRGVLTADGYHIAYYDALENVVFEVIVIGNTTYVRTGNNTRWQATTVDPTTPVADVEELPAGSVAIYRLEDQVTVRGVPTIQYQLQINPSVFDEEDGIRAYNYNQFLAVADNTLAKDQITVVANDPTLGDYAIEAPSEYYGFNDPANVVNRPPADQVDAAQIDLDFPGADALQPWARPFVAQQLAELRVR